MVTGRTCIKYCSKICFYRADYLRTTDQAKARRKQSMIRRAEKAFREAPPCSVCGKSSGRHPANGHKLRTSYLIPSHIQLCTGHRKGYACFIAKNGYWQNEADDIFAAYLVVLTYQNADARYTRIMREAFISRQQQTSVL